MPVIMVLLGMLLGVYFGNGVFGALVGGLLGWLTQRSVRQAQAIAELRQTLTTLRGDAGPALAAEMVVAPVTEAAAAAVTEATTEAAPATPPAPQSVPRPDAWARLEPPPSAPMPAAALLIGEPVTDIAAPPASAAVQPSVVRPDLLDRARAWLLGGNTIARAGVGILFIGLAFLAKYASEHTQVPVEVRLAGIGAVALPLLGLGWKLRSSRPAYAQALQGGAVAVLYLTLFAAFRGYGVIAAGPVFVLMVAVAALAAALAVLQDARWLALIGAVGGYATPLLVSTGSSNVLALFSYYLVLGLGVAAVAWFRSWRWLSVAAFVFTYGVGGAWGVFSYASEHYAISQAFVIAYFLLFNAVLFMPARRASTEPGERWVNGSLLFGLPTITFALEHGLLRDTPYGTAFAALLLAAFYVALAVRLRRSPQLGLSLDGVLAIATVFLILVVPFALDARGTAGAWALEGAGLVWLGLRQQRRLPRVFGYLLMPLAGAAWIVAAALRSAPSTWFNGMALNGLLIAAAALAAGCFVQRAGRDRLMRHEGRAEPLLIALALVFALLVLHLQIDALVPVAWQGAAWLIGLSLLALVSTSLSLRLGWPALALPTLAHAPLMALFAATAADAQQPPWADGGALAWPLALGTHALLLWRAAPAWPAVPRKLVHGLGVLVLAALVALLGCELGSAVGEPGSAWAWLGWLAAPAALLALLTRPGSARLWPVRLAPPAYRLGAAGVLTAGLLGWTLLANIVSDGRAHPLPYVPLLSPLDLGVALALAAAAAWLRGDAARPWLAPRPQLAPALLGACGFVWLNAMLVRGFHHFAGVPYRFDDWVASLAVQTGLTLLWSATALALMWLSALRGLRAPWVAGAVLLGVVVLKLLLMDLSGSGTVARIVSFIGVGALMLVIAYVAPLPNTPHETK